MNKSTLHEESVDTPQREQPSERTLKAIYRMLIMIALMIGANLLYFGRDLIMPLVLGLLLATSLSPVVRLLTRYRIPAPAVSFLMVLIAGLLVLLGSYSLSNSLSELAESVPDVRERIQTRLLDYEKPIASVKQASDQLDSLVKSVKSDDVSTVVIQEPNLISAAAATLGTGAATFAIAMFMALFLLSTGSLFHEKLLDLMPGLTEKKRAIMIIYDIENQVSRYLLTITLINAGLGIVIAAVMMLLSVPNAWVWGVAAMFLNYLPFLGAILGAVAVGLVSLTSFDTIGAALLPALLYYACSIVEGSFVTPLIIGHRLSLNIVAVFLSVTIWGWLWGVPGFLMAVPILIAIKVICDHIQGWAAFGHFLSGRIDWAKY